MINKHITEVIRSNNEKLQINEVVIVRNDKAIISGFGTRGNKLFVEFDDETLGRWDIDDPNLQKLQLLTKDSMYFFHSNDSKFNKYNRSLVKVVGVYDKPTNEFDIEVLPVYNVEVIQGEFPTVGVRFSAFHDELLNTTQAFKKYNVEPIPYEGK